MKSSVAEQQQIQSQLDSLILGENSQIASLKAQLAEAEFNPTRRWFARPAMAM